MLGHPHDDVSNIIIPAASGAACDLFEIAHAEDRRLLSVVFPELREKHGVDGHVDADAKRIRSADEFEASALRELFDEDAVAWQQAGRGERRCRGATSV
ncbi:MAG: hypothetical protein LBK99_05475 [Opitutaceae bacterium]|nr:hypothetical protein [Opitutaceae bacterium]